MTKKADEHMQAGEAEIPSDQVAPATQTVTRTVTVQLPLDLANILQQRSGQVGQTPAEVIVSLLRLAVGLASVPVPLNSTTLDPERLSTQQELQSLKTRLHQLEALIPRLERLEGK